MRTLFARLALMATLWTIGTGAFAQAVTADGIRQLVRNGQSDAARGALAQLSKNPIDRIFLEVDIAEAEGRVDDAVDLLRQLVAIAPGFLPARQRLATLLVADNRLDSARFHYQELGKLDRNPRAKDYYAQQIAQIDALDKFSYNFNLEIVPSANINNASIVEENCILNGLFCAAIPEELQAQKGVRFSPSVSASYRYIIADHQQFILNLSARADKYSVETLDNYSFTIAPSWRYSASNTRADIGLFYTRRLGDDQVYGISANAQTGESEAVIQKVDERAKVYGFNLGLEHQLTSKLGLGLDYTRSFTDYDDEVGYGFLDSVSTTIGGQLRYRLDPRNELRVGATWRSYDEAFEERKDWPRDYTGLTGSIGWRAAWQSGFVTDIGLQYGEREYKGLDIFSGKTRHDYVTSLDFSVQNNKWNIGNFTPRMNCNINDTNSNIINYEYDLGFSCGLSLSTEF